MYGCESWTIKKAEPWRSDAFELWCWRRLLRVPWTARRSNQSILKEISPEYSLEGLMLKLKLQYFGRQMGRTDSLISGKRPWCWEWLKAGGEGDNRGWDGWVASLNQWTWVWASSGHWWWTGKPGVLQSMKSQTRLSDWTELYSTPAFPVLHHLPELAQTQVHWFSDATQPSHLLSSPSPAFRLSQHQGLFQWVTLYIRWPKYWSFSISPSNEYSGLISFSIDWFYLLAVQGTLRVFSNTTVQKHQSFGPQPSLWSNSHIDTWLLEKP